MSSPRQKTFSSRSISSKSAWRMASRYVTSAIVGSPACGPFVNGHGGADATPEPERIERRRVSVDADERIERLGHRRALGLVGRRVDLALHASIDLIQFRLGDAFGLEENAHVAGDRIVARLPLLDLARRDVRLVVVFRVPLSPVGDQLDERDALP